MYKTYNHKAVEASNDTLNNILDLIVEGTWDWNRNTGHVDRSPGWYRMLGYEVGIFLKDVFTWENIIHQDDYSRVMENFELYTSGRIDKYCIEYRCKQANDEYLWIVDRGKALEYNPDGSVARMIGAHQNIHAQKVAQNELIEQNRLLKKGNVTLEDKITKKANELEKKNQELKEKISEVEHASNTDALTDIANRRKLEIELAKEILRSNRYNHPLSLTMFDIDNFKHVNDTLGHKAGDIVLKTICKLVSKHLREIDLFARWGGEEFVILFPNLPLENALIVAEKLRILINECEIQLGLFVTCSFGVTEYCSGDTIEELFLRMDKSLYHVKENGKNRVES
ncbi:sensor domain-containing diguanylate cyclase [Colwellia sp. 12G3]|uniref:sensor domain-containing diguanylate cyclase n=1 Tax=Colwellia sp. 12G3 TaxID=2058299 RepID=UPI000C332A4B|nr:diguanylate cyclase [Colwellia sp. 12G3]PKI18123.1 sensory box protein [Colwellia sp. 12G3]